LSSQYVEAVRSQIRVLVVDGHPILAEGLRRLLDGSSDIEVIGVSGTVDEAVSDISLLHPDVVLMDYQLSFGNGEAAVARMKQEDPTAHVVMLTGSGDEERLARRAFEAGCAGFVGSSCSVDDLLGVIRAASTDEVLIATSILLRLIPQTVSHNERGRANLSKRELEVLNVMAEGGTDKETASRLFISLNTARTHSQRIIQKLGAHSKLEAVVIAMREGVIDPLQ
jgi:DNA-binding NarL/FixJ family response regulator